MIEFEVRIDVDIFWTFLNYTACHMLNYNVNICSSNQFDLLNDDHRFEIHSLSIYIQMTDIFYAVWTFNSFVFVVFSWEERKNRYSVTHLHAICIVNRFENKRRSSSRNGIANKCMQVFVRVKSRFNLFKQLIKILIDL